MARTSSIARSKTTKPAPLKPIAQDAGKAQELDQWCRTRKCRETTATLRALTGDQFKAFTNQSLAKKMAGIFDNMFGRGCDGPVEDETLNPEDIMSSARAGNGLESNTGKITPVPPVLQSACGLTDVNQPAQSLYSDNENAYVPWIDIFPFTHEAQGEGPVDYIGISMGADGMVKPEAEIKEDGMLLEIMSCVPSARDEIDEVYESRQDKYLTQAGDKDASKESKKSAKRKYNMLEARRTAQLKAVREMKAVKGNQWKVQFTRVPLDVPVEKNIVNAEVHKGEKGKTLSIDLKVVRGSEHIDRLVIKEAVESPEKP